MRYDIFYIILVLITAGCSTLPKVSKPTVKPSASAAVKPVPKKGTVFAKTVFEGVVKTSYVRLSLVNLENTDKSYNIYIGDKLRQQSFPWVEGVVSDEYFFVDLPAGEYRINSIAIPVGTILAEEPMNVTFRVEPNIAIYLGDLIVRGTREMVRVGGIPVIHPGFEYTVEVADNAKTAIAEFHDHLPRHNGEVKTRLMQIRAPRNFEIGTPF